MSVPPSAPKQMPSGHRADSWSVGVLVPLAVGAGVAVLLGVYGAARVPTGFALNIAGFSTGLYAKAWLASLAALLGVVQLISASVMYGKVAVPVPAWLPGLHRWSGRLAVLVTVPVMVHCLFALGFQVDAPRVLVHSLLGCLFYGAFVTKMLSLTRQGLPEWVLPVVGGVVFAALIGLWLTSALWVFGSQGLHL